MKARLVALAVAILLVALGIGLGAGPLQHNATDRDRALTKARAALADRDRRIQELQGASALGTAYTSATAARVVAGLLAGRKVALVTVPGADRDQVDLLRGLVHAAGGEVTSQVDLAPALFDDANRGLVDALTSQMAAQTSGLTVPAYASGYQRFGALLARAIGVPPSAHVVGAATDATAISIASGFKTANLVSSGTVTQRAGLTLIVLPAHSAAAATGPVLAVLKSYLAQIPGVVAAPAVSAEGNGLLAGLRSSSTASVGTVDSLDTPVGRVDAILALAARTRGVHGSYGVVGSVDAAVPPVS